jgi:hypothetical protein
MIDAGHDIEMRVLVVVTDHIAQERIPVSSAAAIIRLQDHVALGCEHLHIVAPVAKAVFV